MPEMPGWFDEVLTINTLQNTNLNSAPPIISNNVFNFEDVSPRETGLDLPVDKKDVSRHNAAITSHFDKLAYKKILGEIDDLIFILSPSGVIVYASPSCKRLAEPQSFIGQAIITFATEKDKSVLKMNIENSLAKHITTNFYCRFLATAEPILFQIKCKPFSSSEYIMLSAREYNGDNSMDALLELQLENLVLKAQLETECVSKGREVPKLSQPKEKRKKNSQDLFCRQCGTHTSPEWRKGPLGPKTLCNACGIQYSKKLRSNKT